MKNEEATALLLWLQALRYDEVWSVLEQLLYVKRTHQRLDVDQGQCPFADLADAGDVRGVDRPARRRRWTDCVTTQFNYVGHRIDDRADHPTAQVEHDHDREVVILGAVATEHQA